VAYASKIVLELPLSDERALQSFVEACLRDGVSLIAVVGEGASRVDDMIDELVVGDGSDTGRYITTTMHPDEAVEDAIQFAANWEAELGGAVQLVRL
jgi:hypothetical protein